MQVEETTTQKGQTEINPGEILASLVKSQDKDAAIEMLAGGMKYLLAKKDELAKTLEDINTFLKHNKELVVLVDPAIIVSVSLRDVDSGMSLESMLKGPGSPRHFALEAALGRGKNLQTACENIAKQIAS